MTDEELTARIQWRVGIAPNAKPGPKWTIAAEIPKQKPGDRPVGEAMSFKYTDCPEAYVTAATRRLQADVVARYRRFNEAPAGEVEPAPPSERELLIANAVFIKPEG